MDNTQTDNNNQNKADLETTAAARQLRAQIEELQSKLSDFEKQQQVAAAEAAPLKTLYKWEAPDRIFNPKGNTWYTVVSLILVLAIAFAAITQDLILIIVLLVLGVLVYLANTIKPNIIKYELTNKGIKSPENIWQWTVIEGFWFSRRSGQQALVIDLVEKQQPNRVMILLGSGNPEKVLKLMMDHVPYFTRKQIGEDIINAFTYGEYVPLTEYIEADSDVAKNKALQNK